jgi:hypothetical protein
VSQFEYISVAVSLILAMGVTRLASGIAHVAQGSSRYWVHVLWCLMAAVNQAMAKSKQLQLEAMKSMTGGMNLPGLDEALQQFTGGPSAP